VANRSPFSTPKKVPPTVSVEQVIFKVNMHNILKNILITFITILAKLSSEKEKPGTLLR